MPDASLLRSLLAAALAVGTVYWFDRATRKRGFDPPGFAHPARRVVGLSGLAFVLWLAAFTPALAPTEAARTASDFAAVSTIQLFAVHGLLLLAIGLWFGAGFLGVASGERGAGGPLRPLGRQLGLLAPRPAREVGLGVAVGLSTWSLLLLAVLAIVLVLQAVLGDDIVPKEPPAAIPFIAALPALLRLGLSLSAGVVEELFFRGLLQPRVGVWVSTALFALAHAAYGQPLMLIGITLLSLLYSMMVRYRRSLLAAMAAHATFDAVQLLIVIPNILELFGGAGGETP